jgi:4-hydroxy-tetrahydrodipicolinate synthase
VLFYKHLMVIEGNPEYELHFCATDALSTSQKRYAEDQLKLFKAWYGDWSKSIG